MQTRASLPQAHCLVCTTWQPDAVCICWPKYCVADWAVKLFVRHVCACAAPVAHMSVGTVLGQMAKLPAVVPHSSMLAEGCQHRLLAGAGSARIATCKQDHHVCSNNPPCNTVCQQEAVETPQLLGAKPWSGISNKPVACVCVCVCVCVLRGA
jgi:hypothetical protein